MREGMRERDRGGSPDASGPPPFRGPAYKTKLCALWRGRGGCPRPNCGFAHGEAELRRPPPRASFQPRPRPGMHHAHLHPSLPLAPILDLRVVCRFRFCIALPYASGFCRTQIVVDSMPICRIKLFGRFIRARETSALFFKEMHLLPACPSCYWDDWLMSRGSKVVQQTGNVIRIICSQEKS